MENRTRYLTLAVLSFIYLLVLSACSSNASTQTTNPGGNPDVLMPDFFNGEISLTSAQDELTYQITLKIKPDENATDAQVEWYVQDGVEIVKGEQKWKGDLEQTKEYTFEITVKTTGEAEKEVRAWVHTESPGSITTNYRVNTPKK